MNVSSSRRSSPAFNRRGFAEPDLDSSGFDFVAEDAEVPGPPRLSEHEERLRLNTLHTLLRLRDLEHPVVAAMCEVLRSVFDAPTAGKSAIDRLRFPLHSCEACPEAKALCIPALAPHSIALLMGARCGMASGCGCVDGVNTEKTSMNVSSGVQHIAVGPLHSRERSGPELSIFLMKGVY